MTEEQRKIKRVQLAGFSGYGKQEHSKCKKPEYYEIRRTAEAERAFDGLPPKQPHKDIRKFPNRLCFRLPDDDYRLLQQVFEESKYTTMQDFLRAAVMYAVRWAKGER